MGHIGIIKAYQLDFQPPRKLNGSMPIDSIRDPGENVCGLKEYID
jgi:hypothetical protein